jgi:tellurite resistance protein
MSPLVKTQPKPTYDPVAVTLHQVVRDWGELAQYGWTMPPPKGIHTAMCKAILSVAGGDGVVSQAERNFMLGRIKAYGAPEDELEEMATFDFRNVRLQDVIAKIPQGARRAVIYDAILTSQVDGFHDKEREAARRAATVLGVDPEVVDTYEALIKVENSVRDARMRISLGRDE